MDKLILTSEKDIKNILNEIVSDIINAQKPEIKQPDQNEELVTNLRGIAKLFNCSIPTAQKIKNRIPKNLYSQIGKTFAIKKSVLLQSL